ncbi:MAG: 4-(cytidine 5'-diphospho)-2-C-methyl-D-erythritol kinase [Prochlorococcaceae cyanobacterium]
MHELRVEAPAKVNLHLEVLGLRGDGFHELAMVMQSIDLLDELQLGPSADGTISLSCDQPGLPTDGSNLIVKAAELLKVRAALPELGARITLSKRIPVGAGLAGGSSDAAAALVGLNALWGLGFSVPELQTMAARLGSDVPFCLPGGTQLCFGRGERLEALPSPGVPPLALLLIKHAGTSVSTPWAYGRCREQRGRSYLAGEEAFERRREALRRGTLVQALRQGGALPPLRNDLQSVLEPELPTVREGLALLRRLSGTLAVAMSGSGPSLFALFADREQALAAQADLRPELESAGFCSWACAFRARVAMLES